MSFQAYLDTIEAKTGLKPEDFRRMATKKGLMTPMAKASVFIDWLARDYGLVCGHERAVVACLCGKTE